MVRTQRRRRCLPPARGFAAYPRAARASPPPYGASVTGSGRGPREIARLAVPEVEAGRVFTAAEALPVYLRDNVAQVP